MKYAKIFSLVFIIFSSCNSERRATRLIHRAERVNPVALGKECADRFPPIEFVKDSIVYRPGKVIPGEIKYVDVNCDSLLKATTQDFRVVRAKNTQAGVSNYYKIPCPPCDSIVEQIQEHYRHTQAVNKAREQVLTAELQEATEEAIKMRQQRNIMGIIAIGLFLLIALRFIVKRFKG